MKTTSFLLFISLSTCLSAKTNHAAKPIDKTLQQSDALNSKPYSQRLVTGTPIAIYDSIVRWDYITATNTWAIGTQIYDFTFDSHYNVLSRKERQWSGNEFDTVDDTLTYDANNNLTRFTSMWETYSENSSQYLYTYDANNRQISGTSQRLSGSNFINDYQYTYTYDTYGNRNSYTYKTWNGTAFVNNTFSQYYFDTNNNDTAEVDESWNGSSFATYYRFRWLYDNHHNQTREIDETSDGSTFTFSSKDTLINTLNANHQPLTTLWKEWNGSSYVNSNMVTFAYDANGNQIDALYRSLPSHTTYDHQTASYDLNNFQTEWSNMQYDNSTGDPFFGVNILYYFHTVVGINEPQSNKIPISVYPNPANESVTATIDEEIKNGKLKILNTLGQEVYSTPFSGLNKTIPLNLPSGLYIINIISQEDDKQFIEKFVIK